MLRRASTALLLLALTACVDEQAPTAPSPAALFGCLLGQAADVPVGGVLEMTSEQAAVCLAGGAADAVYVAIPFFAADDGALELNAEIGGGGFRATPSASQPAGALAPADAALARAIAAAGTASDPDFHHRLRLRERQLLEGALQADAPRPPPPAAAGAVPQVGELATFNVSASCTNPQFRTARVVAVSSGAIVYADTAAPAGGFTAAEYAEFAALYDALVRPVAIENFGAPTDIDGNDREILLFTPAVNLLTEPGSDSFVGGFFWTGDLLPRDATARLPACPFSNTAEMFYLLLPDPQGVFGNAFSTQFVRQRSPGTIGHELQHLINAGRRLYVNQARELEEVWLNEGLSHIAEELLFYAASGLAPRQNIDLDDLRASANAVDAFLIYAASNFGRFERYLRAPQDETLLGQDELPTRGASWAFLRYVADHEDGPDAPLFFRLVNGTEAGVANLRAALGAEPISLMQSWTVTVFTDDAVPEVAPIYTQPSWNFRSIMSVFTQAGGYPLDVTELRSGEPESLTLLGGGAAFLRFAVSQAGRAVVSAEAESGRADRLRISVVRVR